MDRWLEALTAFGGFAAIGVLIDIAMYKSEKAKLKAKLEDWWLRFTDVKWSNFGRKEAELAIQVLDRWAGARLWSVKRWSVASLVTIVACILALGWNELRFGWRYNTISITLLMVVPSIVTFALSLTVTRLIAVSAAQLSRGAIESAFVFSCVLAIYLILFLYWSAIVFAMQVLSLFPAMGLFAFIEEDFPIDMLSKINWPTLKDMFWRTLDDVSRLTLPHYKDGFLWPDALTNFFALQPVGVPEDVAIASVKVLMDIVANGLRVMLALVFLSSFVFKPLIQEPVTRLWYGAMNSDKPVFTILFSSVGAIVATAQALSKSHTPLPGI